MQEKPSLQWVCVHSNIHYKELSTLSQVPTGVVYAVMTAGYETTEDVAQKLLAVVNQQKHVAIQLNEIGGWHA